jgi:hypothetical protein
VYHLLGAADNVKGPPISLLSVIGAGQHDGTRSVLGGADA